MVHSDSDSDDDGDFEPSSIVKGKTYMQRVTPVEAVIQVVDRFLADDDDDDDDFEPSSIVKGKTSAQREVTPVDAVVIEVVAGKILK